jgi:hypothetical protein
MYNELEVKNFGHKASDPLTAVIGRAGLDELDRWKRYHAKIAENLPDGGLFDRETYKGVLGKMGDYVIRIALILRAMETACNDPSEIGYMKSIDKSYVDAAIEVAEYFMVTYLDVYSLAGIRKLPLEAMHLLNLMKRGKSIREVSVAMQEVYGRGWSRGQVERKIKEYRAKYPGEWTV